MPRELLHRSLPRANFDRLDAVGVRLLHHQRSEQLDAQPLQHGLSLGLRQSLRAASLTNVAQVLVLLICAFSIDRDRPQEMDRGLASSPARALLAMLGFAGAHSVLNVMILGTLSYGIIGSANAVLYLYTPEIYPTRMRAIGTGLATSWLRLASAVGPALVGFMVAKGTASVFLMFAGVSVSDSSRRRI